MPTDLFLQDAPLPAIPDEMVRPLRHILEAAGHSTLWNAGARTLVIDSPLEGRVIRCEPLGQQDERTGRFVHALQRRVDTAGGIVAEERRPRPDVTLWIRVEPCEADDRTRVLLNGRPRGWFSRRAPLAEVVGEKLRTALRVPVGITLTCGVRRQELQVYLWAPEEAFQAIATALWLGLMAYFRKGPPVQVPPAPPEFVPEPSSPFPSPSSKQTPPIFRPPQPDPTHNKTPEPSHNSALHPESNEEPPKPERLSPPRAPESASETADNPAPHPPPPTSDPPHAQQPSPNVPTQAETRSTAQPESNQGGRPITRRIPFDEPVPGTVIWSSGDFLPLSRRVGSTNPSLPAMMPPPGTPSSRTAAPGMPATLPGQQPTLPGHPPLFPQPPSNLDGTSTTVHNPPPPVTGPESPEPRPAVSPPLPNTPPGPPPTPPPPRPPSPPPASPHPAHPLKEQESQKGPAASRPIGVQTIQATVTSGNGFILKRVEQKTEHRRPHR